MAKDKTAKEATAENVQPDDPDEVPEGQDFKDAESARKAATDRASRGELENESQGDEEEPAPDARTVAKKASTSATSAKVAEGRQVAVIKEDPTVDTAGNKLASKSDVNAFLKLTGYKASDVIGSSEARRTYVTSNGGKYVVSKSGKKVRVVSGPAYPKLREQAEEEDEE